MGADMIDCNQLQSNLSLPFGKVRMGYHTGRDRYSWFVANKWTSRILLKPKRSLTYWGQMGNIRAANVPKWGNVLAHVGQRAYPKWASTVPKTAQKSL